MNEDSEKRLELLLEKKELKNLIEKYPDCLGELRYYARLGFNLDNIHVEPMRPGIFVGSDFATDSKYHYFSSTKEVCNVRITFYRIWCDVPYNISHVVFYMPKEKESTDDETVKK
ncbi:MAG: hypothetical protein ACP5NW_05670 [Candidatus Woesearchaeota archaeon]